MVFPVSRNLNDRAHGGVFDGVIHQIDNDLHDQPCIHIDQEDLVPILCCDGVFAAFPVDMMQCLFDHFVHQLRRDLQIHPPILNAGDGKQIFHQTDQPLRIVKNIGADLVPGLCIQRFSVGKQIAGIAGNGGQRGAQVMGDRAQQVCPQLFIPCLQCSLLFFQRISAVFDGQRTFAQNGKQHTVFKGIQRFFGQIDPDHSKHAASGPKRKIKPLCIRVAIRACTGTLFVGKRPVCRIPFFRCRKDVTRHFPVNRKKLF